MLRKTAWLFHRDFWRRTTPSLLRLVLARSTLTKSTKLPPTPTRTSQQQSPTSTRSTRSSTRYQIKSSFARWEERAAQSATSRFWKNNSTSLHNQKIRMLIGGGSRSKKFGAIVPKNIPEHPRRAALFFKLLLLKNKWPSYAFPKHRRRPLFSVSPPSNSGSSFT